MKLPKGKDIKEYFERHPMVVGVVNWSKRRSFPGFFNVPLYDITIFLAKELQNSQLQIRANSVAFSFMLALFPATIVLISLIPYLPLDHFVDRMEQSVSDIVPHDVLEVIMKFIREITDTTHEGLLSLGFVLALFFSSNGTMALLQGFDKKQMYGGRRYNVNIFKSRSFIIERLVALQLVGLLGMTLVLSVSLIVGGNYLIHYLVDEHITGGDASKMALFFIRWLALLFLFYASTSLVYRYGPSLKRKFDFFSPGATLAALFCLFSSWLFTLYVDDFGTYNQLYGSLGVLIACMLWLKINAFILLAGFELNTAIAINRDIKLALKESEDDNDVSDEE